MEPNRLPPHNIECEQALLGAILNNSAALDAAEPYVTADDFFEPVHGYLFQRFATARQEGAKTITYQLVSAWLGEFGKTNIAGMPLNQYLARLAANATTVINAEDYARQIKEHTKQRQLIEIAKVLDDGARGDQSPHDLAMLAIDKLDVLTSQKISRTSARVSISAAADDALVTLQKRLENPGTLHGLSCGVSRRLDNKTGGFANGDLIILAGRPGMGKTALAISSAYKSSLNGNPGLFFSLEMNAPRLANRAIASACYGGNINKIPYFDIESGTVSDEQYERYVDAVRAFKDVPLAIEQEGGLTIAQVAARARRHKQRLAQHGLVLGSLWVDYLGLILASRRYAGNKANEIGEISGALKTLAKELDVPVIALAQLNRLVEGRDNKRPMLSDLRDSGAVEQDADVVMFAYREAYYLQNIMVDDPAEESKRIARLSEVMNKLEIIVAKSRNGPTGPVELFCDMPCNYFADIERAA